MPFGFFVGIVAVVLTLSLWGCSVFSKEKKIKGANVDQALTQSAPVVPEALPPAQGEARTGFEQEPSGVKNNGL